MDGAPEIDPIVDSVPPRPAAPSWKTPLVLFLLTVVSVFFTGAVNEVADQTAGLTLLPATWLILRNLHRGWTLAVPLLGILVTHEFGHYVAAVRHRVPASLPHFLPLPLVSPFGTLGAFITMRDRIRSRNALLDIGAAGPLAGLVVAIPVLVIGLMHSPVKEITGHGFAEGQCILYMLIKRVVLGPIPEGHDVFLNSTAFAGWGGLLVTMLNLLPIGQLDGGHIAYALFDTRQQIFGRAMHLLLPVVFLANFLTFREWGPGLVWLVWFGLLGLMRRLQGGVDHPPTEPGELSFGRRAVAVLCLVLFALLFMPTPLREY
jgi:membrane-associated protease RseP (regulator of RpoE activity)